MLIDIYVFKYIIYILFLIGLSGLIIMRLHLLLILLAFELILLGFGIFVIYIAAEFDDIFGQILFIILLCLAGVESAFGLILLIIYYKLYGAIEYILLEKLKHD